MFFDEPKIDHTYHDLLLSIAKKQRELLNVHFDWKQRKSYPLLKSKGLFGKKKRKEPQYELLLNELAELKRQIQEHRQQMGYSHGIFWWNIPWEQVEDYLIFDLEYPGDGDGWRFERNLEIVEKDDMKGLFLFEEGHCSNFSTSSYFDTEIVSKYSASEINQEMRNFTNKMNTYDLTRLYFSNDRPVHSVLSGRDYTSMADYLLSTEHYIVRDHLKKQYAKSIYNTCETTTVVATSNSVHYKSVYAVAEYHITPNRVLDHLGVHNYDLLNSDGSVPQMIKDHYTGMDAAVSCAAFLADNADVSYVPMELFGKDLVEGAANYSEAMRQSELYTCLAHKILIQ